MTRASLSLSAARPLLEVRNISKRFGGLVAVNDCSLDVERGTVVGIIGSNGSGKSTLFNLVMGLLPPDSGAVFYDGQRIDRMPLYRIARLGIGRTYQSIRVFPDLSVWMNLEIAAMGRRQVAWEENGLEWLGRFRLDHLAEEPAERLSVGQQRLLELAMNLVVTPDLLLLDEPLAGVNPVIRDMIAETIDRLRARHFTFLIIEHHMNFVMRLCDRIIVLDHGEKIADGVPEAVQSDPLVLEALLGQRRGARPS